MLILVEANWVVCWQGLLMRSPEACFNPAGFCCSTSSRLEPAFTGNFLPVFCHTGRTNSKGVSFSLRQDSTRKALPPQNKQAEPQPTSFSPLTSQNIPAITVRWGRSSKLTTGHWRKIHKSPPRRQRWDRKGNGESRKWQCEQRPDRHQQVWLSLSVNLGKQFPYWQSGIRVRQWGGVARVKRDLTSNIKVSRGRVASPGAVDCHALVLALVRLLAVLNLQRSWGGRPKFHSSGQHHTQSNNTHIQSFDPEIQTSPTHS